MSDASTRLDLGVTSAEIVRIDARRWFGVAVDACCLVLSTAAHGVLRGPVAIRADFNAAPAGWFTPAPPDATEAAGTVVFRQGIKHDAADVFELRFVNGSWRNGLRRCRGRRTGMPLSAAQSGGAACREAGGADGADRSATAPGGTHCGAGKPSAPAVALSAAARGADCRAQIVDLSQGAAVRDFRHRGVQLRLLEGRGRRPLPQPRFRAIGPQAGRPVVLGDTSYFVRSSAKPMPARLKRDVRRRPWRWPSRHAWCRANGRSPKHSSMRWLRRNVRRMPAARCRSPIRVLATFDRWAVPREQCLPDGKRSDGA